MYTGHVTAGGSICLEALTTSGTPGSWQPDFSVESLLNVVVVNMVDCPKVRPRAWTWSTPQHGQGKPGCCTARSHWRPAGSHAGCWQWPAPASHCLS